MTLNAPRSILPKLDESLLSGLPPFSKLSLTQISTIIEQASCRRHNAGSTVFQEGEIADRFFLLLDGVVRVIRLTKEGEQVISLHIPSGQLFGIAKALGRASYPATAVAATDLLCLSWPMSLWDNFVANYDGFASETYKTVGARLGEMNDRIMEMATQHVEQRIANVILRLINQTGRKTEGGIEIDFPITRQDISEMAGTTLYTVSRLLSSWEKQGLIESGRKRIIVRDAHKIVLISGGAMS